jgi:hypothetical protein
MIANPSMRANTTPKNTIGATTKKHIKQCSLLAVSLKPWANIVALPIGGIGQTIEIRDE